MVDMVIFCVKFYYNYRNKDQIVYNQEYLDYICIIRNFFDLFYYHILVQCEIF